jgi:hypothetical protein
MGRCDDGWVDDENGSFGQSMPPGEEGMFMSHAGGEDEVYRDILETFVSKRYVLHKSSLENC